MGYLHIFGGALLGHYGYRQFLSPKIPAGIANDLAYAGTVTLAIVLTRKFLGGKK